MAERQTKESPLKVHHLRPAPGAHTAKTRVGRAKLDGQFELIFETADLVEPDPFPKGYQ